MADFDCRECGASIDPHGSPHVVDTPATAEGRGYRVVACACPRCGATHVALSTGTAIYRDGQHIVNPETPFMVLHPAVSRGRLAPEVPPVIGVLFVEAKAILDASPTAAALLARRLLQDTLQQLGYASANLFRQIESFLASPPSETSPIANTLHMIREIGNRAAHGGSESQSTEPIPSAEATLLLLAIEALLERYFVLPAREKHLAERLSISLGALARPTHVNSESGARRGSGGAAESFAQRNDALT